MGILDGWVRDMPQQFQGKERIGILLSAFARQLEELYEVFRQLDLETDLGSATGRNLDMVGDILALTRKDAGELAGIGMSEPVLLDARYAQILKYRILRNTSDCTYYDIMAGLEYLYDFRFNYRESPDYPATVILNMPVELEQPDFAFYRNLCIKPSGVRMLVEKKLSAAFLWDIKYEARLDLTSEFYPRYNLPLFLLDGTAFLDGRYTLNGYQEGGHIDFYPVSMEVAQGIRVPCAWHGGVGVSADVEAPAKAEAGIAITGGAASHAGAVGRLCASMAVSQPIQRACRIGVLAGVGAKAKAAGLALFIAGEAGMYEEAASRLLISMVISRAACSWQGKVRASAAVEIPAKMKPALCIDGKAGRQVGAVGGTRVSGGASLLVRCGSRLAVEYEPSYLDGWRTMNGHWPLGAGRIEVDLD